MWRELAFPLETQELAIKVTTTFLSLSPSLSVCLIPPKKQTIFALLVLSPTNSTQNEYTRYRFLFLSLPLSLGRAAANKNQCYNLGALLQAADTRQNTHDSTVQYSTTVRVARDNLHSKLVRSVVRYYRMSPKLDGCRNSVYLELLINFKEGLK